MEIRCKPRLESKILTFSWHRQCTFTELIFIKQLLSCRSQVYSNEKDGQNPNMKCAVQWGKKETCHIKITKWEAIIIRWDQCTWVLSKQTKPKTYFLKENET
jgi:hypothetical protein